MKKITNLLFYLILFAPFMGIVYTVLLGLPRYVTQFYVVIYFGYGVIYFLSKKNIKIPKYFWFLFAFALFRMIRVQFLSLDVHPVTKLFYSVESMSVFFAVAIIYNTKFSEKFIENSMSIFKVIIVLSVIASIIQIFDMNFLDATPYMKDDPSEGYKQTLYQWRRQSIFGFVERNAMGLSFLPMLSVLVGIVLKQRNKKYFLYLAFGAVTTFLTNSRYVMVGFLLITFQVLVYNKTRFVGYVKYFAVVAILGVGLLIMLNSFGYDVENWYQERLFKEGSITESTRYNALVTFAMFFPDSPILGTGFQTDEIKYVSKTMFGSSHIHVGYLSILVDNGILGAFFIFMFWYYLFKMLYRHAKKTNFWGAFFSFLVFFWALLTMSDYSIFYAGLLYSLIFDKYYIDKLEHSF